MNATKESPLTPALCEVLETCIRLKTTNAKIVAAGLNRSPATVRTEFQRILAIMNVHNRYAALKIAEDKGWINSKEIMEEE